MEEAEPGDTVLVHYTGGLDDQTVFCDSRDDQPVELVLGEHVLLPALEGAFVGMSPGQDKSVRLQPEQAYGHYVSDLVFTVPRTRVPPEALPEVGQKKRVTIDGSDSVEVTVMRTTDEVCVVDGNHPLVGRTLNFSISLVGIL